MIDLNRIFKKITGKEIIRKPSPFGVRGADGEEQLEYLEKERRDEMERQKAEQRKAGRKARRLHILTTNDLEGREVPGKGIVYRLRANYLELREARRKAREEKEDSPFGSPKQGL